jgi:hypothetical protein
MMKKRKVAISLEAYVLKPTINTEFDHIQIFKQIDLNLPDHHILNDKYRMFPLVIDLNFGQLREILVNNYDRNIVFRYAGPKLPVLIAAGRYQWAIYTCPKLPRWIPTI